MGLSFDVALSSERLDTSRGGHSDRAKTGNVSRSSSKRAAFIQFLELRSGDLALRIRKFCESTALAASERAKIIYLNIVILRAQDADHTNCSRARDYERFTVCAFSFRRVVKSYWLSYLYLAEIFRVLSDIFLVGVSLAYIWTASGSGAGDAQLVITIDKRAAAPIMGARTVTVKKALRPNELIFF